MKLKDVIPSNDIPLGYCQCECGQRTNPAPRNDEKYGYIKGKPMQYVAGHGRWAGSLKTRFWSRVSKGNPDECWLWEGAHVPAGYGILSIRGHQTTAHRVSYLLHFGEVPDDLLVCHICDNPPCCNPAHLFLGTDKTNAEDKSRKGRAPHGLIQSLRTRGERNPHSILTEKQVIDIRTAIESSKHTQVQLAKIYGVKPACINKIITRRTWKHIAK